MILSLGALGHYFQTVIMEDPVSVLYTLGCDIPHALILVTDQHNNGRGMVTGNVPSCHSAMQINNIRAQTLPELTIAP